MGKQAQTLELSTNLKLCTIPRVMYCGAIARVIGIKVCAIVHNVREYGVVADLSTK